MSVSSPHHLEPLRPRDRGELCAIVSEAVGSGHGYVLVVAGTDYLVEETSREPDEPNHGPPVIVDVSHVEDLRGIAVSTNLLRVGATATYPELLAHHEVLRRAPLLARMAREMTEDTALARATLGGDLADGSSTARGCAAVAAYDAVLILDSVRGERQLPFSELQMGPNSCSRSADEIIVAIDFPLPGSDARWFWRSSDLTLGTTPSRVALAAIAEISNDQLVRLGLGMTSVGSTSAMLRRTRELGLSTGLRRISSDELDKAVAADISPADEDPAVRFERETIACALVRDFFQSLGARV